MYGYSSYDYITELAVECRRQKSRWNGKVITTSKQWQHNDHGSVAVDNYSMADIYAAARDAQETDRYYM